MPTEFGGEHRKLPLEVGLGCFVGLLYRDNEYLELPFASSLTTNLLKDKQIFHAIADLEGPADGQQKN
jgi:hypothetical protein